jgi:hypothetical protein
LLAQVALLEWAQHKLLLDSVALLLVWLHLLLWLLLLRLDHLLEQTLPQVCWQRNKRLDWLELLTHFQ